MEENTGNLCVLSEHLNVSHKFISILDVSCVLHHFWTYYAMLNATTWRFITKSGVFLRFSRH